MFLKIVYVFVVALFCCFCFLLDRRYLNNWQLHCFFNLEISKHFLNINCTEPPKDADIIIPIFYHIKQGAQGPSLALPHAQQSLFMLRTRLKKRWISSMGAQRRMSNGLQAIQRFCKVINTWVQLKPKLKIQVTYSVVRHISSLRQFRQDIISRWYAVKTWNLLPHVSE